MKRVFLFLGVNIAIMVMISFIATMLGVSGFVNKGSINYSSLAILSIVVGFTGAFISLALSKFLAKKMMGVNLIDGSEGSLEYWIVNTVKTQSEKVGIKMPEVGIFNADEMNAFATGPTKNNSLVAISTGLLNGMSKGEVEAVIAHEVSHISNGDMVTSTLLQGVLNTFVFFLARVCAFAIDSLLKGDDEEESVGSGWAYLIISMILDILFGILASIVVAYHSRSREYKADEGASKLVGSEKMISALAKLAEVHGQPLSPNYRTMGISNPSKAGLFATHPSIEERISKLQN